MPEMRFDDRVAVVTGGGRGLGRDYALLLAARGAKVVVNDLGGAMSGEGADAGPAQAVVDEIRAAGGQATASTDTVATPAGGKAIIEAALDHYGRIDILIHSAGNVRYGALKEISQEDFDAVVDVHLRGGFHVLRPAFPIMCKAGFGRIVMTSSIGGLYGNAGVVNYAVSKAGLIGLTNVAAIEGAAEGVKANAILPGAITRMAEGLDTSAYPPTMDPSMVAPLVGYLSHEGCAVSGEYFVSVAGRVARAYVVETPGAWRGDWTIEAVAEQIDTIRQSDRPVVFPTLTGFMDHLGYSFEMCNRQGA
jgi:NAD(P)-dependent dehydrogenase (short-subunit alcohol dehydrogenase family)